MLDKLFGHKVHPYLQLLGLIILAVGLPMNKVLMSIGTIWLASNLLLNADFKNYLANWKSNRIFWFIIGFLLLHILGLTYTEDIQYALRDINTKLPLFVIPIAVIAFPIQKGWLKYVLYFYLLSLCVTTSINLVSEWYSPQADFRSISLFGSHIRFTILVATGVLVAMYLIKTQRSLIFLWLLIIVWLLFYIYQSQVFSGYLSLLMLLIALVVYQIITLQKKIYKSLFAASIVVLIVSSILGGFYFFTLNTNKTDFSNLPEKTPRGNKYLHDTSFVWYENGNHVMSYISEKELRKSWNKRSKIDYDSLDQKGHEIKSSLIRYMSSKGVRKDKDGMKNMSTKDIENVEAGFTNINQVSRSPFSRLKKLRNDIQRFNRTGNPNGNSITERLEHYKIGFLIAKDHWLIGVGTGDPQLVFNEYYEKTNSKLSENNWHRAHNQFLTFWITFGVFGFIVFTLFWYHMMVKAITNKSLFALGFVFIAIGSFLSEDTIETQQGVTFIAFFIALTYLSTHKDVSSLK